ncbi:hypothetical protein NP233_g13071 [Leucocoprinus birnbaumii]|uniref:Cytochrome P450 n=1 Tax=Leucocoprinus birnbaumii TaxID=56174 RepID=A0AAD5VHF8_9AGAR|nr:hypothetical protein NP233_g13071 [Leucocoprinus birnbaumii]
MREMIPLFYEVTERVQSKVRDGSQEVDVLEWMSRTALKLIGQSGMGYSFDNLVGGPFGFFSNQFIFPLAAKFNFPRVKRFIAEHAPWKRVQDVREMVNIMHRTSIDIIQMKKNATNSSDPAVAKEMLEKKDIISILNEEVCGQVSTFIIAGTDTTSAALARVLDLLSTHQEIQTRLRNEIREAQKDGQLSYDQLVSLPFLDAVCRETLRLCPPLNFAAIRTARKDMLLPASKPVTSSNGDKVTEVVVPNGSNIIISDLGSNTNGLWGNDANVLRITFGSRASGIGTRSRAKEREEPFST